MVGGIPKVMGMCLRIVVTYTVIDLDRDGKGRDEFAYIGGLFKKKKKNVEEEKDSI